MKRYRIGIDGSLACSQRPTGVEYFARSLLGELVHLGEDRVEWFVYLPPVSDPGVPLPESVRVRRRPDVNTLIKQPWFVARTWLDRLDVVYSFGHKLPAGCRGRYALTVHDTAFDEYPDCYAPGAAEMAHAEVVETCARAARVVVPSLATQQNLIRDYGYPEQRIDVILEASRPEFTPRVDARLPDRIHAIGIREPFILSVGRLDRRKNVARVIDAYRDLLRRGVDSGGLVIVGPDDSGSGDVKDRLESGRVPGERIHTTGYLSEPELLALYQSAAVFVYPSFAEGFGLPVLEAMASGTPTITSCVSSLPEVAGEAGLLVDPTDTSAIAGALEKLLNSPALRARMIKAGLKRSNEFTWRRSAVRLYESLLRTVEAVVDAPDRDEKVEMPE